MEFALVFGQVVYEPRVKIDNPHTLEGWNDVMGVPYWILGTVYNRGHKWSGHRKDKLHVMGENGFWHGATEEAEFFIQDNDYPCDPRFTAAMDKYGWIKKEKKDKWYKAKIMGEFREVRPNPQIYEWVNAVEPAPMPAPAAAGGIAGNFDPPPHAYDARGLRVRLADRDNVNRYIQELRDVVERPGIGGAQLRAVAHPAAAEQPLPDEAAND